MVNRPVVVSLFLLASSAAFAASPAIVPVTGYLTDSSGTPLDGPVDIQAALYPSTGSALFTELQTVDVDQGQFTFYLNADEGDPNFLALFRDNGSLYLGLTVESGPELTPRFEIGSSPYASWAQYCDDATTLGGSPATDYVTINDTIDWSDLVNVPSTLADGDADTTYLAGSGLALIGTTFSLSAHSHDAGEVTTGILDVARLPVGTGGTQVAAGDHSHDLGALTGQLTGSQLPSNLGALVDGYATDAPLNLAPGSTIGGATIVSGSQRLVYHKVVTGTWLQANATFGTARGHSLTGSRVDWTVGSVYTEKLLSFPIVPAGTLSAGQNYIVELKLTQEPLTADNDPVFAISDGVDFVGIQANDVGNTLYANLFEGKDGVTIGGARGLGSMAYGGATRRHHELLLRLGATTELVVRGQDNIPSMSATSLNPIDRPAALSFVAFANDAPERYGIYEIEITITAESP